MVVGLFPDGNKLPMVKFPLGPNVSMSNIISISVCHWVIVFIHYKWQSIAWTELNLIHKGLLSLLIFTNDIQDSRRRKSTRLHGILFVHSFPDGNKLAMAKFQLGPKESLSNIFSAGGLHWWGVAVTYWDWNRLFWVLTHGLSQTQVLCLGST